MVSEIRTATDTDATVAQRLDDLFAAETERVANAAVLAELLAPLLSERVPSPVPAAAEIVPAPLPPKRTPAEAFAPPSTPRAGGASIADFIDEMIALEKPAPNASGGGRRRAS